MTERESQYLIEKCRLVFDKNFVYSIIFSVLLQRLVKVPKIYSATKKVKGKKSLI